MTNKKAFNLAKQYIPGGVNSPVRSFKGVDSEPFFTKQANGCYLYDIEGNCYIDYVCSWGANIIGHANSYVVNQVSQTLSKGFSYGTPTEGEVYLAQQICELMPSIEKLRLVSSGTEAVMSAIRLARGYTNRKYIVKFNGCYHGHADSLLVKGGSGLLTLNTVSSSGVNVEEVMHTIVLEYNDIDALKQAFTTYNNQIACVVVEPIAGNMNLVRPSLEFMGTLKELCTTEKALLIFDEVMTGFRVALGGAQQLFGIQPDLTTLGKIVGGGMPLAAFGGRAEIMDYLSPIGTVYQAGTLSGNPIAVNCGLATLELVQQPGFYDKIELAASSLTSGLCHLADRYHISFSADSVGGMFGFYFDNEVPTNLMQVKHGNEDQFKQFFNAMLQRGVYFAPSMYEAGFVCIDHDDTVINKTLEIADEVFSKLK